MAPKHQYVKAAVNSPHPEIVVPCEGQPPAVFTELHIPIPPHPLGGVWGCAVL